MKYLCAILFLGVVGCNRQSAATNDSEWHISPNGRAITITPGYAKKAKDIINVDVTIDGELAIGCGIVVNEKAWESGRCSYRPRDENGKVVKAGKIVAVTWSTTHDAHQPPLNPTGGDAE